MHANAKKCTNVPTPAVSQRYSRDSRPDPPFQPHRPSPTPVATYTIYIQLSFLFLLLVLLSLFFLIARPRGRADKSTVGPPIPRPSFLRDVIIYALRAVRATA